MPDEEKESLSASGIRMSTALVQVYVMFLFMWQALFRVSNTGMSILHFFIAKFFTLVPVPQRFVEQLPQNITAAKKLIEIECDNFTKYASCPKCHTLYLLDSCRLVSSDKSMRSRLCCHIKFPNHPKAHKRHPCDTPLMKIVRTVSGTTSLHAKQLYCS